MVDFKRMASELLAADDIGQAVIAARRRARWTPSEATIGITPTHWQLLSNMLVEAELAFVTPDGKTIELKASKVRFSFDDEGDLIRVSVTGG